VPIRDSRSAVSITVLVPTRRLAPQALAKASSGLWDHVTDWLHSIIQPAEERGVGAVTAGLDDAFFFIRARR
jgi:hypothetical protein